MHNCPREKDCAFTHCDERFKLLPSIENFEMAYCHGVEDDCIRYKLADKFGEVRVPSNMMPNGMPLPGTHRRDWTDTALHYKRYLENRDY